MSKAEMDPKHCGECFLVINELEPIRCGFCDTYFHISQQCCGFNNRANRDLFSNGKAMFICPKCRDTNGRSVCTYIEETMSPQPPPSVDLNLLSDQVQKLTSLVEALSKKVEGVDKERPLAKSVSTPQWPKTGIKRRRGSNGQPVQVVAVAERGTNTIDLSDLSVPFIVPPPQSQKCLLYLSGFQPLVKVEDVQKIVARCLDVQDSFGVVRLVAKDADITKLSYVSFKIGLDPGHRTLALNSSTWPAGLLFREFEQQSGRRRPDKVTTVGTPLDNAMEVLYLFVYPSNLIGSESSIGNYNVDGGDQLVSTRGEYFVLIPDDPAPNSYPFQSPDGDGISLNVLRLDQCKDDDQAPHGPANFRGENTAYDNESTRHLEDGGGACTSVRGEYFPVDLPKDRPPFVQSFQPSQNTREMYVYFQNVRGLRTKSSELFLAVDGSEYDVIVLVETNLDSTITSAQLFGEHYVVYRNDRDTTNSQKKSGGGVLIAVHRKLPSSLIRCATEGLELVLTRVHIENSYLYICAGYIPPELRSNSPFVKRFGDAICDSLRPAGNDDLIVVCGDFNQANLVWKQSESSFITADPVNVGRSP